MDEVIKYQESIAELLGEENSKFKELDDKNQIDEMILRAKEYHEKLVNIKKSMLIIKDKASRLKRKANKLLEDKEREEIERQRSRERREFLERHLEPVVNTNGANNV